MFEFFAKILGRDKPMLIALAVKKDLEREGELKHDIIVRDAVRRAAS